MNGWHATVLRDAEELTLRRRQWDHCFSSLLIRSSLGLSFGVVFSVLLFKRRAWPALVGLGFGAGRAYEECNNSFLRATKGSGAAARTP
jgi:inner membrane organizing system protein 1